MTAPRFIWETQLGVDTPYGFISETYDENAFDSVTDWTDISEDVRTTPAPTWSRGMAGGSPEDRVARVGVLSASLNNFPKNAPRRLGYYTPGHANQRTGWDLGHGFRLRVVYKERNEVQFMGTIETITPHPGTFASRAVDITVTDWMEEAATSQVEGLSTLLDVKSSEVFTALVSSMPRPPLMTLLEEGLDTYAYALDTVREEGGSVHQEFFRLAMSELGFIFVKADGTLVFQSRSTRGAGAPTSDFTFDSTMQDLSVRRSRTDLINKVKITTNPRRRDAEIVVLYSLSQPVQVASGQILPMRVSFSDPDQRASRAGAVNIQPMVADVDYVGNTAEDGTGSYATFLLGVSVTADSNGADVLISNVGSATVWLTRLQIRGQGLYTFEPVISSAQDDDSIAQYGRRTRTFDMPYQSDALIGASAAKFFLNVYAESDSLVESLTYLANTSDTLMRQALSLEIGSRIGIRESVTATTDAISGSTLLRGWYINGVRCEILNGMHWRLTYVLAPSTVNEFWTLGVSELGLTTRLGFGLFEG